MSASPIEPFISIAYKQGIWGQPIYNAAKEFGPFPNTAVNVLGDTIEKEPALVKGLSAKAAHAWPHLHPHPSGRDDFLRGEGIPNRIGGNLKASLDRAFADDVYSTYG